MFLKRKMLMVVLMAVVMTGMLITSSGQALTVAIGGIELSEEQVGQLATVLETFGEKQFNLLMDIERKLDELEIELQKEDRFTTMRKERKSARKSNKLIRDITSLYGNILRNKIDYMLQAKDVLTKEQKERLIRNLDFDLEIIVGKELPNYLDLDILTLLLGLTDDQVKKILKARTDMQIKELRIELDIDYSIIDLEAELLRDERDPEKVNKLILNLTDLGTQLLDNKVDHFLRAKDVLTVPQKQRLLHAMMIASGAYR